LILSYTPEYEADGPSCSYRLEPNISNIEAPNIKISPSLESLFDITDALQIQPAEPLAF